MRLGDQKELFKEIKDNSVNAIITDPPYGLNWNHKIETEFNFEEFIVNAYRVIKNNGFLVYFGMEPSMSNWNTTAQKSFHYLAEVIWYKRKMSNIFQFPLRVHEKIMIFTKGKGKLNKATISWEKEKEELIDFVEKGSLLRVFSEFKRILKISNNMDDLRILVRKPKKTPIVKQHCNDKIYDNIKYKIPNYYYYFNDKKLTTLWGCMPHNSQKFNKDEYNIKHPTVKPIQIIERLIEMTTNKNDIVLDPFMGSGTTGVACKNLNRQFIGFEIHEDYYEIAKNRINNI